MSLKSFDVLFLRIVGSVGEKECCDGMFSQFLTVSHGFSRLMFLLFSDLPLYDPNKPRLSDVRTERQKPAASKYISLIPVLLPLCSAFL